MRRAAKIDANQPEIVEALEAHRCSVKSLAAVGDGCPDLLVWSPWTRSHELLEVKDGAKSPSRRKLTDDQVKFHAKWGGPIHVVTSVDEALRAVGVPGGSYAETLAEVAKHIKQDSGFSAKRCAESLDRSSGND
jgi:hypothetical protein